jgi:hypothetical protein
LRRSDKTEQDRRDAFRTGGALKIACRGFVQSEVVEIPGERIASASAESFFCRLT